MHNFMFPRVLSSTDVLFFPAQQDVGNVVVGKGEDFCQVSSQRERGLPLYPLD